MVPDIRIIANHGLLTCMIAHHVKRDLKKSHWFVSFELYTRGVWTIAIHSPAFLFKWAMDMSKELLIGPFCTVMRYVCIIVGFISSISNEPLIYLFSIKRAVYLSLLYNDFESCRSILPHLFAITPKSETITKRITHLCTRFLTFSFNHNESQSESCHTWVVLQMSHVYLICIYTLCIPIPFLPALGLQGRASCHVTYESCLKWVMLQGSHVYLIY